MTPGFNIIIAQTNAVTVVNTKTIYLAVLETGLSLIAVNLPSLWFLVGKVNPESVLRSVRSMLSLSSQHSRTGAGANDAHSYPLSLNKNHSLSSSSHSHLTRPDAQYVEAYAMHDLKGHEHAHPPLPPGRIQVTDRIVQSAVQV